MSTDVKRGTLPEEPPACPKCGSREDHPPAVRQGVRVIDGTEWGVADIGWRCESCSHEWGFEVLTP